METRGRNLRVYKMSPEEHCKALQEVLRDPVELRRHQIAIENADKAGLGSVSSLCPDCCGGRSHKPIVQG